MKEMTQKEESTTKYLPKHEQVPSAVKFVLTDRDLEILKAVNDYRYLRTNQIKRLVFSGNRSMQSTRRRLKYLYHNKFLGRVTPFVLVGEGASETAYFLDKNGREILKEHDVELKMVSEKSQVKTAFLHHALDLSEFRVNLEMGLRGNPTAQIHRFSFDFEMKSQMYKIDGMKRYKLYDEVTHPVNKQKYVVYPDALVVFKGKDKYEKHQKLYFVEIDRGTETLNKLREKVIGYNLYHRLGIYNKFGKFNGFRVLIQTSSEKRALNLRKHLTDQEGEELIWITDIFKVNDQTIVKEPIWLDHKMEIRSILKKNDNI